MPDWMTVRQLLAYCKPFYPTWDDRAGARLIELMALPLDRKIKQLSRGMRMKAALVSSLAYRPKLLMLDEPFTGLDPLMRDEFVQGVLELAGEGGWSAVISSHDLEDIERLIDWVGYLRDGQLAFSESITGLQSRFRQIDISLLTDGPDASDAVAPAAALALPTPIPASWLNVTTGDRALRFVHARYTPVATEEELRARFPGAQIHMTPISLRETFIALARQERAAAPGTIGEAKARKRRERRKAGALMKLVAHMIGKDLRAVAVGALLWILVMALEVALQLTGAAAMPRQAQPGRPSLLSTLQNFLPFAEVAVAALIVSLIVHEDPLVDARAFWLTRPIPRQSALSRQAARGCPRHLHARVAALVVLLAWHHVPPLYMMRAAFEVVLWLTLPVLLLTIAATFTSSLPRYVTVLVGAIAGGRHVLGPVEHPPRRLVYEPRLPRFADPGRAIATGILIAGFCASLFQFYRRRDWRIALGCLALTIGASTQVRASLPGFTFFDARRGRGRMDQSHEHAFAAARRSHAGERLSPREVYLVARAARARRVAERL